MRLWGALLALVAASCSPAPATQTPAHPALWKLADADTTIYLFGTIHILPSRLEWQSPKIKAALNASQGLVLETVLGEGDRDPATVMRTLAARNDLPPVVERVPADRRALLDEAVRKSGVPLAALDVYETWAVALTLAAAQFASLPGTHDDGAEQVLTRAFRALGKPVSGLETPAEQLGYFDALPEDAQRRFLISVIEDKDDPRAEFQAMISAWTSGDLKKIELTFSDEAQLSPELMQALLVRRNQHWTDWIAHRLDTPGTVFVAVGAGHLAGPRSVEAMLAARGLKVERLQ